MMPEPPISDDRTVSLARHDARAMAALYDAYYPVIFRYCLRRLFLRAAAEDVTSSVFLNVAANIRRFKGTTRGDFEKWLFVIASNEAGRYLRKQANRQRLMEAAVASGRLGRAEPQDDDNDLLDWPAVYSEILTLRPEDQNLLVLRFFEDCSTAKIAELTGMSHGAVRTRLSRIITKLRQTFTADEVSKNEV